MMTRDSFKGIGNTQFLYNMRITLGMHETTLHGRYMGLFSDRQIQVFDINCDIKGKTYLDLMNMWTYKRF